MGFLKSAETFIESKIAEHMQGFTFPATRDEIVAEAQEKHLPEQVVSHLEKIPDRTYDSPKDLVETAIQHRHDESEASVDEK